MRKKETNNHQSSFDVDLKEYWSSRKKIDGSLLWKDQSLDCKGQKRAQFSVFMTDGKSNLTRIYRPTFISFFGGHFITQWKKIVANRLVHNVKWGGYMDSIPVSYTRFYSIPAPVLWENYLI